MKTQTLNRQAHQTDAAKTAPDKQSQGQAGFQDNRSIAAAQRTLSEVANNSPRMMQQKAIADMMNNSPRVMQQWAVSEANADSHRMVAQRRQIMPPLQAKRAGGGAPPIQRAAVNPQITGGTKATKVTLNLAAGDHVPKGSVPSVDIAGWAELQTLGLTKPGNSNEKKWVRFHALNEHAGGPGNNAGNLTSATAAANHAAAWTTLETNLKNAVPDAGGAAPESVAFAVDIAYPGAAAAYWRKHPGNALVTTDAQNYPNDVNATLSVNGVAKPGAHLTAADNLYGPEHFRKIANWKRKTDNAGAYGDVATDAFPGANAWDT